ncbi:TetR/AcrR family transcriptional regulator [Mycobacterium sp.]|uniref:TetR/AcrR family transcriptional regulator n=1 Tax=Mycobacterium sp. TaxID=1785 RepID=UPI0025CE47B0|nr:TetR/AcrR family transcriptional regulator [Mycobacterium sp.]MBW0014530.1 TetR/AcrR family transcriptional regulator [Mycobacterium sp.]
MSAPPSRRRPKLAPDPDVRCAIVDAASQSMHEQGVVSIAAVLERARLSTRAFYRHFESKDQLVAAVVWKMASRETQRLRTKMADTACPVEAVIAWIDGRLDLPLDESTEFKLRDPALGGGSKEFLAPELVSPAYDTVLGPLVEQLQRGLELGAFADIVPAIAAKSIDGVVWAAERQRAAHHRDRFEARQRTVRFCLRGLGVAPEMVERYAGDHARAG